MRHFPVYLDTRNRVIVVTGTGPEAVAKLRLLLKTEADLRVFGSDPYPMVVRWAAEGRLTWLDRSATQADVADAALLYAANGNAVLDRATAELGRATGVKTLIVDNLDDSDFITPAIVDRDPVTVAIGTEGAAPVLARKIKADIEAMLPTSLGKLARIGQAFRPNASRLPDSSKRRAFWSRFYFDLGPRALADGESAEQVLPRLLDQSAPDGTEVGHVHFVGAGPGDPELLTLKARKQLHDADVVIHDRLVSKEILELVRREATIIEVGKTAFGPSWRQADINTLLVERGRTARVVRLKSGDGGIFGRLDEETEGLDAAGITYSVTPGITAAAAAASVLKTGLTKRGRNSELRIITGHLAEGYADHDWRALARPGAVAAVYMGKAAAAHLRGRLLMHGADQTTPITIVENVSRSNQRIVPATLMSLAEQLADVAGPAVLLLGIAPRDAETLTLKEAL